MMSKNNKYCNFLLKGGAWSILDRIHDEKDYHLVVCRVAPPPYTSQTSPECLIYLLSLKNIISHQLPSMTTEYITRTIFDWNHHSLVYVKDKKVIGGIVLKAFVERRLGEAVFLAVSGDQQGKYIGSILIKHLKEYARSLGITKLLTFADSSATTFFEKQGFSKRVTINREIWGDIIKDYKNAYLMECKINAHFDMLHWRVTVQRMKEKAIVKAKSALESLHLHHAPTNPDDSEKFPAPLLFSKSSNTKPINPPFSVISLEDAMKPFKEAKRIHNTKNTKACQKSNTSLKCCPLEQPFSEPLCNNLFSPFVLEKPISISPDAISNSQSGEKTDQEITNREEGYHVNSSNASDFLHPSSESIAQSPPLSSSKNVSIQNEGSNSLALTPSHMVQTSEREHIIRLHIKIIRFMTLLLDQAELVWPFLEPIDPREAPNYYLMIRSPVDLTTIKERILTSTFYTSPQQFYIDLKSMVEGILKCANRFSEAADAATEMERFINEEWMKQEMNELLWED
ncbi:putative histone acetyltransferase KAT2B [Monocercomonoides exilis]|uniref:putative histone acetyltransferase KAT2B n=1 Tax=Monocercomonoides exilis TaxID=2049356 RepID=UPI003559AD8F|nr:putative histone acetyltransferase KAT2B [Monocercomonoides exilis]|eukprot:MONOS_390.1-p1 / transcript=MONOS_390.1 / gene=MONOS_390 / organism=Monocercomonoides_exilis_PA203 / gene_product=histone acetyltransferase KAT2B / transcript_product=histone acetyltransferase KAT2B / location=Mono_scaffold00006:193997-195673(+) / protein_length=511 / sequence_SO=supercontig / SO=protein_coding / is_pseudo=false